MAAEPRKPVPAPAASAPIAAPAKPVRATIVLVLEPKDGTKLVSVTWPGLIGVLSGMNEHGVAGATMMIHQGEQIRPGLPYMLMYREALMAARKAGEDAEAELAGGRRMENVGRLTGGLAHDFNALLGVMPVSRCPLRIDSGSSVP